MISSGKKTLLAVIMAAMTAAVGFIVYTSRQAAAARDNPNSRARQIDRAAQDVQRMLER